MSLEGFSDGAGSDSVAPFAALGSTGVERARPAQTLNEGALLSPAVVKVQRSTKLLQSVMGQVRQERGERGPLRANYRVQHAVLHAAVFYVNFKGTPTSTARTVPV